MCSINLLPNIGTIRERILNSFRYLIWNPLKIVAADGLWFPILIDDERQGIKQWEMARARGKGKEERGARAAGGRSTRIDGIFFTQRDGVTDLIRPLLDEAFTAQLLGYVAQ